MSGYNALLLIGVAQELFHDELKLPLSVFDPQAMKTVVRYVATSATQEAQEKGDYQGQFWSSVALSGLNMIDNDKNGTLQHMRDACETPSASLFDLRVLEERAKFLIALEFRPEIVSPVLDIVQQALRQKAPSETSKRVIVFHSDPIDRPGKMLAPEIRKKIQEEISAVLEEWNIGKGDLAICSACNRYDVFFGEKCLDHGARVRVLLLEPSKTELIDEMRIPDFGEWTNKRAEFLARINRTDDLWFHHAELGRAVDATSLQERHSRWILNTARIEGEKATAESGPKLYGLALSDGRLDLDQEEDSSYFVAEIRKSIRFQGVAHIIDPHAVGDPAARGKKTMHKLNGYTPA